MGMTVERGLVAAQQLAQRNRSLFDEAVRRYGSIIDTYLGNAPRTLLIAHVLRVNPNLYTSPTYADYRGGFMGASVEQSYEAETDMSEVKSNPAVCAYTYSRDINRACYSLYTTYESYFPKTGEDLWRCAYLRTTLGDTKFRILWDMHAPTSADAGAVYEVLRYSVNTLSKALVVQGVTQVKALVLKDCEFVFQLAKLKGTLRTDGPGIEPVPPSAQAASIFARTR